MKILMVKEAFLFLTLVSGWYNVAFSKMVETTTLNDTGLLYYLLLQIQYETELWSDLKFCEFNLKEELVLEIK